jgi:hypothetical protein
VPNHGNVSKNYLTTEPLIANKTFRLMKKIFSTSLLLLTLNTFALSQDIFISKIDTLLDRMGKLIVKDLTNDSIKISPRPWIGIGDSYELEVIFDSKDSFQITSLSRPDSLRQEPNKWELRKNNKIKLFMGYIYKNNEFPYNTLECFSFKFIQVIEKECLPSDAAVYGEYKFKISSQELTIIDKKTEILKDFDAIKKKQLSKW